MAHSATILFSIVLLAYARIAACMPPNCSPGQFLQNNKCELCPPGTFQNENGATSCKSCPPGTYNPFRGAQGGDICIECPDGTFRSQPGAVSKNDCKKCPRGQNAPAGSPNCISCAPGQEISNCDVDGDSSLTSSGKCFACDFGTSGTSCSLVGPVKLSCKDCNPSFFSSKPSSLECERCPFDLVSDAGTAECKRRPVCPPGSALQSFSGTACQRCSSFTFSDRSFEGCKSCPLGFIGEKRSGSTRCVPCPAGTSRNDPFTDRCRRCRPGQNSSVKGAQYCVNDKYPCPPNFFESRTGACLTCTVFERYNKTRNRCEACPRDSLSSGGLSTTCKPCGKGMTTSPEDDFPRCVCKKGWGFVLGSGGTKCEKCPPGTSNDAPSFICQKCNENTFAPRAGLANCLQCPNGFHQPLQGQKRCVREKPQPPCPKGLIRNIDRGCVEPTTNCPPESEREARQEFLPPACNRRSTEKCPKGTVLLFVPSQNGDELQCDTCSEGMRYNPRNLECIGCENDEISAGGDTRTCTACPSGERGFGNECRCSDGRRIVQGRCEQCPPGTFGFNGIDGCAPCPVGTFARMSTFEGCRNCRAGFFTDEPGQRACKRCPNGLVSSGIGDSGCVRPRKSG